MSILLSSDIFSSQLIFNNIKFHSKKFAIDLFIRCTCKYIDWSITSLMLGKNYLSYDIETYNKLLPCENKCHRKLYFS